jgi:hypothetical protein
MAERPYSRYTRTRTWAALHSQHLNAGYAIVPSSKTNNSIVVINCKDPNLDGQDIAKDTQLKEEELLPHTKEIAAYYEKQNEDEDEDDEPAEDDTEKSPEDDAPPILAKEIKAKKLRTAVVLAKSSDYYHYHIEDIAAITLVICGLHDSYLHIHVWEMRTNHRYRPRETAVSIKDPNFDQIRRTQFGHSILLAAYAKGNPDAVAFVENERFPERSRTRINREKDEFQHQTYRGRPLAFLNEAKRKEIGGKISQSLIEYHARRRTEAI